MSNLFAGEREAVLAALTDPGRDDRVVVVFNYGTQRGIAAAAFASVLAERNLVQHLAGVVALSSGAPVAAGLLAGCVPSIASVYAGACCTPAFYDRTRKDARLRISFIVDCLRRHIDARKVLSHSVPLALHVYLPTEQRGELVFQNKERDFWETLGATMAAPGLCTEEYQYNGLPAHDPAPDDPLPMQAILDEFDPTHVLVLTNLPRYGRPSVPPQEQGFPRIDTNFRRVLAQALDCPMVKVAAAFVPPDFSVGMFTQRPDAIWSAYHREQERWRTLLQRKGQQTAGCSAAS